MIAAIVHSATSATAATPGESAGAGAEELTQMPGRAEKSQVSFGPSQALSQQTPSTQNPEAHAPGVAQAPPFEIGVGVEVTVGVRVNALPKQPQKSGLMLAQVRPGAQACVEHDVLASSQGSGVSVGVLVPQAQLDGPLSSQELSPVQPPY